MSDKWHFAPHSGAEYARRGNEKFIRPTLFAFTIYMKTFFSPIKFQHDTEQLNATQFRVILLLLRGKHLIRVCGNGD